MCEIFFRCSDSRVTLVSWISRWRIRWCPPHPRRKTSSLCSRSPHPPFRCPWPPFSPPMLGQDTSPRTLGKPIRRSKWVSFWAYLGKGKADQTYGDIYHVAKRLWIPKSHQDSRITEKAQRGEIFIPARFPPRWWCKCCKPECHRAREVWQPS